MGPGRFFVLRIGSNPAEASSSGRTDGGYNNLAVVVHRTAQGNVLYSWIRVRVNLMKFGSPVALSI